MLAPEDYAYLVKHQHRAHNERVALPGKAARSPYPPFRVPLEVACGIESLLDLHGLDTSRAKMRHLDLACEKTNAFEWVNSGTRPRYYCGKGGLVENGEVGQP